MRVLHLHSPFEPGGRDLRTARLINAFGKKLSHAIVAAALDALGAISPAVSVEYPANFPSLAGKPWPGRLWRMAQAMKRFDLVLTYNWGAMDAALAHSVFRDYLSLPPLIHYEDGCGEGEAGGLGRTGNWYRQIGLARCSALVVPTHRLETIALEDWRQPRAKVKLIAQGIDTAAYRCKPKADALPRIVKRKGELWLGTLVDFRQADKLPRLVRAFSCLPEPWQLVIVGEVPELDAIRAEAMRADIAHRVHLPGSLGDRAAAVGLFDLFALSSDGERSCLSVIEAMAAGLAVAAPDGGGIAGMVCEENRKFVTPAGDDAALGQSIEVLAGDKALRARIGKANRARAAELYDEKVMVEAYRAVYAAALGLPRFP